MIYINIILLLSPCSFVSAAVLQCVEKEKNPLEEDTSICDSTRPNIFVDRNNLLGKNEQNKGPAKIEFQYGTGPMTDIKSGFGLGPLGPSHWTKMFKQCGGKHQSPIDINLAALKAIQMPKLSWDSVYATMPQQITVTNKGYTVTVKPTYGNNSQAKLQGGPLSSLYVLEEIHFHWGSTDHKGSEHTINSKTFPMEMHAVHIKQNLNFEQAKKLPDGIAVVGYIFEVEEMCHKAIRYIEEAFELIAMDLNTAQPLQNMFPMCQLAEPFCGGYVTYKGSLTTPPCSEAVTWIISPYTIGITKRQLQTFRDLYTSSKNLENNFRPVQLLNGRVVHFVN